MTRKKAIEATYSRVIGEYLPESYKTILGDLWEQGRIAGLREAARMAGVLRADVAGATAVQQRDRTEADIKAHARELAKKARGK